MILSREACDDLRLPRPTIRRWSRSRKYAVAMAVHLGRVSMDAALATYAMSREELSDWTDRFCVTRQQGEAA